MPTPTAFAQVPPFPDSVPTAALPRLALSSLLSGDQTESEALFQASTDTGFFLLDLRGVSEGETLLGEIEKAFGVSREFYESSEEEKSKFPMFPSNLGYKPPGHTKIENGKPDRCEIYGLSQDDILGTTPRRSNPPPFESNRPLFTDCMKHASSIASTVLTHLSTHLALPPTTLSNLHSLSRSSASNLRFLHMPPQPRSDAQTSLMGHTDNGSVTILFNILGGLQILPPGLEASETTNWRWVRPEPGCAVVNLGDTMVQWTGGVLRSNMHRVVPPPGVQAECERYSIAYVLKPPADARMERLKSGRIPDVEGNEDEMGQCTYTEYHARKSAGAREGKNLAGSQGGRKMKPRVDVRVEEVKV